MILSNLSHETVLHVARNMRAADAREIYALRWTDDPFVVMNATMAYRDFAWVAWVDDKPAAVFGGAPTHPGVWNMFCYGTDDFPRLALGLTRFCKRTGVPMLFGDLGAHRLQADSHAEHREAHAWLEAIGCEKEGVKKEFGRDRSDYFTFVLRKPVAPGDGG